jgi:hypothetical protein
MTPSDKIRAALKAIYHTGDTVEIRAFHPAGFRSVGRYPLGWDLARAIEKADNEGYDVYYVLNPTSLPPTPLAAGQSGSKEMDIPRRRHYLLDLDPIRQNKIATAEQFQLSLLQARMARDFMENEWGVQPIAASSGNGVHLLVPIDLPNDEPSKDLIRRCQRAVAERFSTAEVECECFPDAARLVRAYGTLNKKGTETEDLKWRRSGLL